MNIKILKIKILSLLLISLTFNLYAKDSLDFIPISKSGFGVFEESSNYSKTPSLVLNNRLDFLNNPSAYYLIQPLRPTLSGGIILKKTKTKVTYSNCILNVRFLFNKTIIAKASNPTLLDLNLNTPDVPTVANVIEPTCTVPTGTIIFNTQVDVVYSVDNGANYQSSPIFSGLTPNTTYNLVVKSTISPFITRSGDCPITLFGFPDAPAIPTVSSVTQPTCAIPSGKIVFNAQVGVEYSINGGANYQASPTFSGLSSGTYNLMVRNTSGNGCTSSAINPVLINPAPHIPTVPTVANVLQPSCSSATATIVFNTQAGVEYSVNNGANYQSSPTFTGLAANTTYNLIVKSTISPYCAVPALLPVNINIAPDIPVIPTASVTQPTCTVPTGSIVFDPQSGVEFSINGGTTYQASSTFSGLSSGTYNLMVRNTSGNGCSASATSPVTINSIPNLPAVPTVASLIQPSCSSATGTIVFNTQAGVEYSVNNGANYQSSPTFTGLAASITYNLIVRSTTSPFCSVTAECPITLKGGPNFPTIPTANVTQPTCAVLTGSIVFNTQTGVEYSINGSDFQASPTFTGLLPGIYNLVVRFTTGTMCSASATNTITLSAATKPTIPSTASIIQPTCAVPKGTIVFTSQTGVEYSINGTDYQSNPTFSGLAPGFYSLNVRSVADTSCTATGINSVEINTPPTAPTIPTPITSSITQPNCTVPTGTIVFTSITDVEYSINGTNYQSSNTFSGLAPGSYTLYVRKTADISCTAIATSAVVINTVPTKPITPTTSSVTQPTCEAPKGTIVFSTQTGMEYSIDGGLNYQTSETFSNLLPGTYSLFVRNLSDSSCINAVVPTIKIYKPICAITETYTSINGFTGGRTPDLTKNDTLDDASFLLGTNPGNVTLKIDESILPSGFVLNSDATVTVPALTPNGTYPVDYKICETDELGNCDRVISYITINASIIDAITENTTPINGLTGGITTPLTANDTLNGVLIVLGTNPGEVKLMVSEATLPSGFTLNANGTVTVPANTPGGSYPVTYKICEVSNDTNCDTTTSYIIVDSIADLNILKTIDNSSPTIGSTVIFTITANNAGPTNATNVNVEDVLPAGYSFVNANPSVGTWTAPNWAIGNLASGISATLTITATVNASGPYANTATISSTGTTIDPNTINNSSTVTPNIGNTANVLVVKSVDKSFPKVGDTVKFTVIAQNIGPQNATNVKVIDILPTGYTYVTASANNGTWTEPNWVIGNLAVGASAILTIEAVINTSGIYTNVAIISADEFDPDKDNNIDTATTAASPSADVSVVKTVDTTSPNVGDLITFTITAKNSGPSDATGVKVEDILSSGYTFDSVDTAFGTWSAPNWVIGNLASGATAILKIKVKVNSTGNYSNTATISSAVSDPDSTNNTSTITPSVGAVSDVSISKTVDNSSPIVGENVTFTISALNLGPNNATGVEVLDALPSGYTIVSATPSVGTWNAPKWTIGDLAPSDTPTLKIIAKVNPTGDYKNIAKISSNISDPNLPNNEDSASTIPIPSADVSVVKTVDKASPNVGDTITFTITVKNTGPSDATGVKVEDILSTGYTFDSVDTAFGTWTAPNWVIGNLASGATATLNIKVKVNSTGNYSNTATIASDINDPDSTNNTSTITPNVGAISDVSISKTVDNSSPIVGENVTFTISALNLGPNNATGVEVIDALPSGYTFVSATPSVGTWNAPKWTIGDLTPSDTPTLKIIAKVNPTGDYKNIAKISSNITDPNLPNNEAFATTVPKYSANVGVVKTVNNTSPRVGDIVTFTIKANNAGPNDATGVSVIDILSTGYTFQSATTSAGTWTSPNWIIGNLANGVTETLTILAKVNTSGPYRNTASIDANENDPDSDDDSSSVDVTPVNVANVKVVKTVSNLNPRVGDTITFTIVASNEGPNIATGVTVNDVLASGYTFISATNPSQGTWTAPNWSIGDLASGISATLDIVVKVNPTGNYTNTAIISATEFDPDTLNNISTINPVALSVSNVGVVKTVNNLNPNVGDTIIFTITAKNTGPNNATYVNVSEILPSGYTFITATPSVGTWNAPNWSIGNLANGATVSLNLEVKVNPSGNYTNTAVITSNEIDPESLNNTSTITPSVKSTSDVNIKKEVSNATPNVGDIVKFTITAKNSGPNDATNVLVIDNLPTGYTFVNATPSSGNWRAPNWLIENLANGATATLIIDAKVNASGIYENTANISSNEHDPDLSNNSDSVATIPVYKIDAVDDFVNLQSSFTGSLGILNVLHNDTYNNNSAFSVFSANSIEITNTITDPTGYIKLNTTSGLVELAQDTPAGTYEISYTICNIGYTPKICDTAIVRVVIGTKNEDLDIYNHITPNDDGFNDYLFIDGINDFPNNSVEIFNKWGVLVYEVSGYNNKEKCFKGFSEGRVNVNKNDGLAAGTYFYILKYVNKTGESKELSGYLFINR